MHHRLGRRLRRGHSRSRRRDGHSRSRRRHLGNVGAAGARRGDKCDSRRHSGDAEQTKRSGSGVKGHGGFLGMP